MSFIYARKGIAETDRVFVRADSSRRASVIPPAPAVHGMSYAHPLRFKKADAAMKFQQKLPTKMC